MKSKSFRLLSVLLTALMLMSMVPTAVMAAPADSGNILSLDIKDTDESSVNVADGEGTLLNGGKYTYDEAARTLTLENAQLLGMDISADKADDKAVFTLKLVGDNVIDNTKSALNKETAVSSVPNMNIELDAKASLTVKSGAAGIVVSAGNLSISGKGANITVQSKDAAVTAMGITAADAQIYANSVTGAALSALNGNIELNNAKVSAVSDKNKAFSADKGKIIIDSVEADETAGSYITPADYTNVDKALEKAAEFEADADKYDNYNELSAAVDAVDRSKGFTEQKAVDKYAEDILTAIGGLNYSGADYTAVDEAIAKVPESERDNYIDLTDFDNAVAAVDRNLDVTQQDQVNAMAEAIENAVAALELKPADYSKVKAAIEKIPENLSRYAEDKLNALRKAQDDVNYDLKITDQDKVDAYAEAILAAVNDLKEKAADYSKVNAAMDKVPDDLSVYTKETADALTSAVDAVDYNLTEKDQDKVDAYAEAILAAVDKLKFKPADYSKVDEAIKKIPSDLSIYTDASRDALKKAQDAVKRDLNITEQKKVDAYAKAILEAVKGLKIRPADYSKVNEAYDKIPEDLSIYTNKTADNLVNTANKVDYKLTYKDQDKVDAYAEAILKAIDKLELKPADYSKVYAAYDKIPEDLSIYTNKTADALVNTANAVDYDLKITDQKKVDAYAAAIEEAICNLARKPAKDESSEVSGTPDKNDGIHSAQTGDNSHIMLWVVLGAVAFCGMIVLIVIIARKKKQ